MGFIDADEFIVLQGPEYNLPSWQQRQQQLLQQELQQQASSNTGGSVGSGSNGTSNRVRDINTFMQQYEQYGGLAVNWIIFGSSGHKSRPHGGVLVNYHACLPDQQEQNTHVKVIANTQYLMTVGDDPHRVYYNSPAHFTVNELGEKVRGGRQLATNISGALNISHGTCGHVPGCCCYGHTCPRCPAVGDFLNISR